MATQEVYELPSKPRPAPPAPSTVDLSRFAVSAVRRTLGLLWRRKLLIGTLVVVGTMLAALAALQMKPLFTAQALVMLDNRKMSVVDFEAVLSGINTDIAGIQSEVAILKSADFAEKVVDKLNLMTDPEFNAKLRPEAFSLRKWLDPRRYIPESWLDTVRGERVVVDLSPDEQATREKTNVIDAFREQLEVKPQGRSSVIALYVSSEDPRKAAEIVNTVADLYLVDQLDEKFEATRRATQWLEEQLAQVREQAKQAGDAVEAYRARTGLTSANGETTMATQQLAELNTNYILARTQRTEAETKYREVTNLLRSPTGINAVGEVLASPLIQNLRAQEVTLQRRRAELADRYGARHPTLVGVNSELADLQTQIRAEVNKIVQNLANDVQVARTRETSLKDSLDQLRGQVDEQQQAAVALRTLERDAASSQTMYETLLKRFQETTAQQDIQQPDARVVSKAAVPLFPSEPDKKAIVLFALVASGALGVMLAFLLEQLEKGFRSTHQIEQASGMRALGLVPSLPRAARLHSTPADYVLRRPLSAFAEALQNLRTGLMLGNVDGRSRVVLFTSSVPGEGKSTIAAAYARIAAKAGHKVVLIDCDLRRKSLHRLLGLDNDRGLHEVLNGQASPQEVLRVDQRSGLHFIAAGHGKALPQDLLGSSRMHQLLSRLALEYDQVILDSPPVLAVSETRLLAAMADQTVFIVQWGRTKREVALNGLKEVVDAGGEVAGVLLSQVNLRRHAQYDFPDSGQYHKGYKQYYVN